MILESVVRDAHNEAQFESGAAIANPFFPLEPGTVNSHSETSVDADTGEIITERNDLIITFDTNEIEGVTTTVVHDVAYVGDVIVENTVDWFAQDTESNVWYFGEQTFSFEYDDDGNLIATSTEGSWEAGRR